MSADLQPVFLKNYRPSDYLIDYVRLTIRLHPERTYVQSRLEIRPNPILGDDLPAQARPPLVLDGDGLTCIGLMLDGVPALEDQREIMPNRLTLLHPPAGPFVLDIETEVNPSANTQLMGLFLSQGTYCTQCEAQGFRRITYFLDRPDVLSVYTVWIEADKDQAPILLSNGNLVEQGECPGTGRHFALWHDPHPKPCYLFALMGGDLAHIQAPFTTQSGRHVTLSIYVEHGKESHADYAMDSLQRAMRWDERVFGREYDLDIFNIVAVSDFNMGAMENKGLNIFNDKYVLVSPLTATDTDYANVEAVIAHEYFHNWTGDRITCRDWFQLSLKEGLTVFRDQEFSSDQRSKPVKRIADVRGLRAGQFVEDSGPLAHNVRPDKYLEIDNFYTSTVYEKGAEVIRTLKCWIGDAAFQSGMDLYFERFDGQAVTVEDFISCFADAAKRDMTQFMNWYNQAGTPRVHACGHYDSVRHTYQLTLKQSTPSTPGQDVKNPVVIPIALGLLTSQGQEIALRGESSEEPDGATTQEWARGVFELSAPSRTITFQDVPEEPIPSLLRGFSAPVRLEIAQSEQALRVLASHDPDPFQRWQAMQTWAIRCLKDSIARAHEGHSLPSHDAFVEEMAMNVQNLVHDENGFDAAFMAQFLTLPTQADLAQEIAQNVDPQTIFEAHEEMRKQISQKAGSDLHALYKALTDQGAPFEPDAASAGKRALRNVALRLYTAGEREEGALLAMQQLRTAENMTDRLAALVTLSLIPNEQREEAFDLFYHDYANEPLVIDKYFGVQAMIPEPGTLARVRRLMEHPAFSMRNPNRLRALISSFAFGNETQFHAIDGSGYTFVADIVLQLNKPNPMVASRLLSAFANWRTLEPVRRAQAEGVLRHIASTPDLTPHVLDIVQRTLA